MKLPLFFMLLITFSACKDQKSPSPNSDMAVTEKILKLNGTWEMVGYYNYKDNKVTDSFLTNDGFRQVKMYTNEKVMWSRNRPTDSVEWFGYGDYNLNQNQLTETLEYGSEMMRKIIDEKKEFQYELVLDKDKFIQIEIDDMGNRIYSENYKRIE